MRKIKPLFLLSLFLLTQSCFSEVAQPITIPGYNPEASSLAPANAPPPAPKIKSLPAALDKKPILIPATDAELQQLITAVDLSYWAGFASYLWTCTPRYYTMPMFNAKNAIQNKFAEYKKKKIILTKEHAARIAAALAEPVSYKMTGLKGISCSLNISVSNVEQPYTLQCYFIILDARYLSRLAVQVSENSGKSEVLPVDTLNAIQTLLDNNCTKIN